VSGVITQRVAINAPPKEVFEALMDGRKHAAFTGNPAKLSRKVGGVFRCYGNYIEGVNLAVVSPKLIIQAWRAGNWRKDTYSIVTFKLAKLPKGRTQISFTQIGVPDWDRHNKSKGWHSYYWDRLNAYFAAN
jgi:uncharacterized protein YndB with AHSA1/START domain